MSATLSKSAIEQAEERPCAIPVFPDGIPALLKAGPQWVAWRYVRRKGKWTKVPINIHTGRPADTTNPRTWATFKEALAYYRKHVDGGGADGIGYVFSQDDDYCGADLDDAIDSETGQLVPWAAEIVVSLNSYSEESPSTTGVKIFLQAKRPGDHCRKGQIEIYDRDRYFAVTGHHWPGTPPSIEPRQEQLSQLYHRIFGPQKNASAKAASSANQGSVPDASYDQDILESARDAGNGAKFTRLWNGDTSGYESASEADLSLCSMLSFWTGPDPARIDRLFRQSGLMRPKWDETHGSQTYGQRTITKALEAKTEFFTDSMSQEGPSMNSNPTSNGWHSATEEVIEPEPHSAPQADDQLTPQPPPRPTAAFYGLAGHFVDFVAPETEADPVAVLAQLVVAFGNCVGRGPHFCVEADRHYTNLFLALIGPTAQGRKGTSWGYIKRLFTAVAPEWFNRCVMNGLATGEGLIAAVRDGVQDGHGVTLEAGVADKRLLVYEPEFARLLKKAQAKDSILSPVLRTAFDDGWLRHHTRGDPLRATDAHISMIVHTNPPELLACLAATERTNGFGNRFLWHFVRRSKYLPEGGQSLNFKDWEEFVFRFREAVSFARTVQELGLDSAARERWHAEYPHFNQGGGSSASLLDRGPPLTRRLACLYALLDHQNIVQLSHLEAALALWEHSAASVRFVFGASLHNRLADEILRGLKDNPQGMNRTQINHFLGRNRRSEEITDALETLRSAGLARREKHLNPDRRLCVEVWYYTKATKSSESPLE